MGACDGDVGLAVLVGCDKLGAMDGDMDGAKLGERLG